MAWTPEDIIIRVNDADHGRIRDAIAERYPAAHFVDGPGGTGGPEGLRIFIGFRPPGDEPLEIYDWVHSAGAGVDHICAAIGDPARAPVVTRTTGRMGVQIGEYCLAYALRHLQEMPAREALQTNHEWNKLPAAPAHLFETGVAVLGTGSIGSGIAAAFRALGARVTGYSRSGAQRDGFDSVLPFTGLAGGSLPGILVLALPATPETECIVGDDILARLDSALLINAGRGSTLDHDALQRALERGAVAHAVLDVFETEPLPPEDWRWDHPRVTVTPHVSGVTRTEDTITDFLALLDTYVRTGQPPRSIDVARGY